MVWRRRGGGGWHQKIGGGESRKVRQREMGGSSSVSARLLRLLVRGMAMKRIPVPILSQPA